MPAKNNQKHGAEAAVRAISKDLPFTGLAVEAQKEVEEILETQGVSALITRNAVRTQTACDLYWAAVCKAASEGNLEALDRWTARYGWLAGVSQRSWDQVMKLGKAKGGQTIIEILKGNDAKQD